MQIWLARVGLIFSFTGSLVLSFHFLGHEATERIERGLKRVPHLPSVWSDALAGFVIQFVLPKIIRGERAKELNLAMKEMEAGGIKSWPPDRVSSLLPSQRKAGTTFWRLLGCPTLIGILMSLLGSAVLSVLVTPFLLFTSGILTIQGRFKGVSPVGLSGIILLSIGMGLQFIATWFR